MKKNNLLLELAALLWVVALFFHLNGYERTTLGALSLGLLPLAWLVFNLKKS